MLISFYKQLKRFSKALIVLSRILKSYLGPRASVDSVTIFGSREFISRTSDALMLLKVKAPHCYSLLQRHIAVIMSVIPSGVFTHRLAHGPTVVTMSPKMSRRPLIEYAATIAHEVHHCQLYIEGKESGRSHRLLHGEQEEMLCVEYECNILRELGADEGTIEAAKKCLETQWWNVPWVERDW